MVDVHRVAELVVVDKLADERLKGGIVRVPEERYRELGSLSLGAEHAVLYPGERGLLQAGDLGPEIGEGDERLVILLEGLLLHERDADAGDGEVVGLPLKRLPVHADFDRGDVAHALFRAPCIAREHHGLGLERLRGALRGGRAVKGRLLLGALLLHPCPVGRGHHLPDAHRIGALVEADGALKDLLVLRGEEMLHSVHLAELRGAVVPEVHGADAGGGPPPDLETDQVAVALVRAGCVHRLLEGGLEIRVAVPADYPVHEGIYLILLQCHSAPV